MRFTFSVWKSLSFSLQSVFFCETQQKILKNLWSCFLCYLVLLFHSLYNITSYSSSSKEYEKNSEHAFVIFHIPFFFCRGAFFVTRLSVFFCFISTTDRLLLNKTFPLSSRFRFVLTSFTRCWSFDLLKLNVEFATSNWREVRYCWERRMQLLKKSSSVQHSNSTMMMTVAEAYN